MANICDNRVYVSFPEGSTTEVKQQFISELSVNTDIYYYDEEALYECNDFEANFGSRWKAPIELLTALAKKYRIKIIGVATEFGCEYVEAFTIDESIKSVILGTKYAEKLPVRIYTHCGWFVPEGCTHIKFTYNIEQLKDGLDFMTAEYCDDITAKNRIETLQDLINEVTER